MNDIQRIAGKVIGERFDKEDLGIANLIREFGCFGEVAGREFEVLDSKGKVLYYVRQKPMTIDQLNAALKMLHELQKYENEQMKKASKKR